MCKDNCWLRPSINPGSGYKQVYSGPLIIRPPFLTNNSLDSVLLRFVKCSMVRRNIAWIYCTFCHKCMIVLSICSKGVFSVESLEYPLRSQTVTVPRYIILQIQNYIPGDRTTYLETEAAKLSMTQTHSCQLQAV